MSATPNFANTPRSEQGQVTTANTARDGSGTPVNIFTAGASGSLITRIQVTAVGATSEGVIRVFLSDGTNHRLFEELLVPASTPSVAREVWQGYVDYSGALTVLESGWSLRFTTHVTETFNVCVFGGDF